VISSLTLSDEQWAEVARLLADETGSVSDEVCAWVKSDRYLSQLLATRQSFRTEFEKTSPERAWKTLQKRIQAE
jgi:hypothetical protein